MSERRDVESGRPWLRAWLVVGLAAWITIGVLLVTRANNLGLVDDISISPYHLVGYAALLTLAVYVAWTVLRSLRRGGLRNAFPPLYGGLGLAVLLLLAWVVLDPIWRATLGIADASVETGLAPPRLLIPAALILVAAGPLREAIAARAERGLRPGERTVRWAGVVASGIVGAALTLVSFNPVQTPVNDWSWRPGFDNSEIWAMDPDGSAQTRLLAALGEGVDYSLPAWSPDGSRIAFTTWTNDGGVRQNIRNEDQTSAVWTMAADGSDRRLVIDGGAGGNRGQAWIPAWSPDGAWIAYTLTPLEPETSAAVPEANAAPGRMGPPGGVRGSSLWIVRPDGTGARRLSAEGVEALGAVWGPDGTLAFVTTEDGGADIHVATVTDAGLESEYAVAHDHANEWSPAWSSDGGRIAFASDRAGNDDIWVVEIAGSGREPVQLTDDAAGDWVPAFSPDGARIVFASDRTGDAEIWSMAVDGSDLRNLSNRPTDFDGTWSISWSPDGGRLAYGAAASQDARSSGWVREDFGAAQMLLFGIALSVVALSLVALGAPFGSFAVALLLIVAAAALPFDEWRFLPGALVAGLLVDALVRSVPLRWRARVAAAALPALAGLAIAITIGVSGALAWSLTLLLGVTLASAAIGWALADAIDRLMPRHLGPEAPPPG